MITEAISRHDPAANINLVAHVGGGSGRGQDHVPVGICQWKLAAAADGCASTSGRVGNRHPGGVQLTFFMEGNTQGIKRQTAAPRCSNLF